MSLPVEASPLSYIAIFDFTSLYFTLLCFALLYFALLCFNLLLVVSYDTGGCKKVLLLVVSSMEFQLQINCKQEAIQINCQVDIHIMMKRTKEHKK